MTEWQWQVILALIRMVINPHNIRVTDLELLQEALQREEEYKRNLVEQPNK